MVTSAVETKGSAFSAFRASRLPIRLLHDGGRGTDRASACPFVASAALRNRQRFEQAEESEDREGEGEGKAEASHIGPRGDCRRAVEELRACRETAVLLPSVPAANDRVSTHQ